MTININDTILITENISMRILSYEYTKVLNGVTIQMKIFIKTPRKRIFSRNKKDYNKIYEGGTR